MERSDYKLSIAYHAGHAGPVEGGRFLEAFDIPWPNVDDGSTCALYFDTDVLPASRVLLFKTLIVDTSKARSTSATAELPSHFSAASFRLSSSSSVPGRAAVQ